MISRCKPCAGLRLFSALNRTKQRIFGDDLLEMWTGRDRAGYRCLPVWASAGCTLAQGGCLQVLLPDAEQRLSLQSFSVCRVTRSANNLLFPRSSYFAGHTGATLQL